jgi:hypothetical protein
MRVYTVEHTIAALNPAAGDGLLVVEAPSSMVLQIISTKVKNIDNSTHEQIHAGTFPITTKGSLAGGGSAPTPRKHMEGDAASACTVYEAGNTGLATEPTTWGGAFDESSESNLGGYDYEPPFDARPYIKPSGLFGVRLMKAPSVAFKALVSITYGEIG